MHTYVDVSGTSSFVREFDRMAPWYKLLQKLLYYSGTNSGPVPQGVWEQDDVMHFSLIVEAALSGAESSRVLGS